MTELSGGGVQSDQTKPDFGLIAAYINFLTTKVREKITFVITSGT